MSDAPPPPPPHGGVPKSSGLPPGNYDIFIIPPHSSGSGFLYLPSLKPQTNSFIAGVACTLIVVVVVHALTPAFLQWWNSVKGAGGMGMILILIAVGLGAWVIGRAQSGGGPAAGGAGPGAGTGTAGTHSNGYANGSAPGPQPGSQPGPQPGPPPSSGPPPGAGPTGGVPPRSGWQQPNPPPSSGPPPGAGSTGGAPPRSGWQQPNPPPSSGPPPGAGPTGGVPPRSGWQRPNPPPGATGANTNANSNTPRNTNSSTPNGAAKGAWEKAREEIKRKEEERKAKEAELKRKADLDKRLKEMREKDAREREKREKDAREREKREKDAREREKREKDAQEREKREKDAREKEMRERLAREKAEREAREAKLKEDAKRKLEEESKPKGSTYAFSAVGEKTNPWPRGRPASPIARSQPPSPTKKPPPSPTAKTYLGTDEDAYSYRPYDRPKKPMHKKSPSSLYSESSYAASQSTSRTTPPPSQRGQYSTKDPDKIVIKAVYAFNNAFLKTPTSQLVSGVGSVTDGLILRITTEGLFIDDDVRGVPQREWDVKAWTMKLVEVWCPSFRHGPAGNSSPSTRVASSATSSKNNTFRRLWGLDKDKEPTSEETDALLVEMFSLCKNNCGSRPSSVYSASSASSSSFDDRSSVSDSAYGSSVGSSSPSRDKRRTDKPGVYFQTGELKSARLHVLRASIRDQEGKRYVFIITEEESWKVAVGLQRLRKGTQVRALGVSGMSANDAKSTLENLGWG